MDKILWFGIIGVLALMQVGVQSAPLKKAMKCKVARNAQKIDWIKLRESGSWYQILNSNNYPNTTSSCTFVKAIPRGNKNTEVSYDIFDTGAGVHTITIQNGWLPYTGKKKMNIKKRLLRRYTFLSTMKIDNGEASSLTIKQMSSVKPNEYFLTDYKTYFIGKMCWNGKVYMWAYAKTPKPTNPEIVSIFGKITKIPGNTPVTFSQCNEVQDFSKE